MTAIIRYIASLLTGLLMLCTGAHSTASDRLLSAPAAFIPQVQATDSGLTVHFQIAPGYYLYQAKITVQTTPQSLLGTPVLSPAEEKEDEFFGKQNIYHHSANIFWPYQKEPQSPYRLTLTYQGCAQAGVCYPPTQTVFQISGQDSYTAHQADDTAALFFAVQPPAAADTHPPSRASLFSRLGIFFLAGLGLSFTACMYPMIPIVSGLIIGSGHPGKRRAFILTLIYTQGMAFSYTLIGIIAGLSGALINLWLQQAWVVLTAAGIIVLLALSLFGMFTLQLPSAWQSYVQQHSNRLSGGRAASVFAMGILSSLIIGPCMAPPLAFALGYIGQTGDALLGATALYTMALGSGLPLILIGTFGAHLLPKAGNWLNGIKYLFGFLLLGVALYLAAPFLPYPLTAALYTLLLAVPAVLLLLRCRPTAAASISAVVLLSAAAWFGVQSLRSQTTALHQFVSLYPKSAFQNQNGLKSSSVAKINTAVRQAFAADPATPVILDFYADWCVVCKQMQAQTLSHPSVNAALPMNRFFTVDVTANTAEHQSLLREYGLFGPPGIIMIHSDGRRSPALIGLTTPKEFLKWYRENNR